MNYEVHKFGGTSLATAEDFRHVVERFTVPGQAIVVSATQGTTSQLQTLLDVAAKGQDYQAPLAEISLRHQNLIAELKLGSEMYEILKRDLAQIDQILQVVALLGEYAEQLQDVVLGHGEQWSAQILTTLYQRTASALYCDAGELLTIEKHRREVIVDWQQSEKNLNQFLAGKKVDHLVITGFIASFPNRRRTILGRNGSDFSAVIFAKLLEAKSLTIWTDVNGAYSADPNKVSAAFALKSLSYHEALEFAYFGATVIHPKTIAPAVTANIPIWIKNSHQPDAPGTLIDQAGIQVDRWVKGLSSVEDIALINIEGAGLIGVCGIAARVFSTLNDADVSVVLISQASSEYSICLAVREYDASTAQAVLKAAFRHELREGVIEQIVVDCDCAILAIIGQNMIGTPGIAKKLFHALANANINILAIAQGASERNISVVIKRRLIRKALRIAHSGFYLSHKTLSIGLIGPGVIGKALLKQIEQASQQIPRPQSHRPRHQGLE